MNRNHAGRIRGRVAPLLSLLLLLPLPLHAIEVDDDLTLRGFYTLDVTYSDSDGAAIPTLHDPILLDSGDSSSDGSLIGLQADYALTPNLDFTLQAISSGQSDDPYKPSVEWAYLSYDLGNNYRLRGGKMKLSMLQGTELRYVGYSRLWVRPLIPSSGAGGFDDYVGAELIKNTFVGDYNLRFQAAYGQADHHLSFIDNRDIQQLSVRIEKEGSWVNVALLRARYDVDTPTGIDIKDNAELYMASIETELLFGNTIVNGGYAYGDAEINPDEQLAYLSLGYRINRLTPYLLVSQRRMVHDASEIVGLLPPPPPPPPGPLPPPPPPPRLKDGTDKTDVLAIGFRYELGDNYALKGQIDHWRLHDDSDQRVGTVEESGNLFTIAIEGVF